MCLPYWLLRFQRVIISMALKKHYEQLAFFGGAMIFENPVGTAGLLRPDFDQFLYYSKQFFDAGQYTNNGPLVGQLEQRLADFHDAEYCVTFCSGAYALILASHLMKLPNRSEVVIPSLAYSLTSEFLAWCGLKPRFCEVDETSLAMTPETVADVITDETALIMGIHPIVNCCDVFGLKQLADEKGIPLIIDSCESVYETTEYGRVGSMVEAEIFSLNACKLINGGEGGYITTSDKDLYEKLKLQRGFGFEGSDNIVIGDGTNAKLNEIHAAMALASLDDLDDFVAHNEKNYRTYQQGIVKLTGLKLREFDENYRTSYKNIIIELTEDWPFSRDLTVQLLNGENVLARAYYSPPLHQREMRYPHCKADLPLTDKLSKRFIHMPSGYMVTPQQIDAVLTLMNDFYTHADEILSKIEENTNEH